MRVSGAANLACALDGLPLSLQGGSMTCPVGHSFDRAGEGYMNLLAVHHKASRDPGDTKAMVAARRRVLDGGAFEPIAHRIFVLLRNLTAGAEATVRILDAGCGEGYYLARLAEDAKACADRGRWELAGLDISKWAIRAAAKRRTDITWVVGTNRHPPLLRGSVNIILSIFGFPHWDSFRDLQPSSGHVLLVDPGPRHLWELRSVIYPTVRGTAARSLQAAETAGYQLVLEDALTYEVELETPDRILDLVSMTPHNHRIAPAGREALSRLDRLSIHVDVILRLLCLKPSS